MHAYDLMFLLGTATVQLALILFIDDKVWLSGLLIFTYKILNYSSLAHY